MQAAKALDILGFEEKAYHRAIKGFKIMDSLYQLRKDQMTEGKLLVNYEPLMAPFYFKLGDFLLNYIMLNTDELGQVKPMQELEDSDEEDEAEVEQADEQEEAKEEAKEEEKEESGT